MRRINLKEVEGPWDFAVLLLEWLKKYWYILVIIILAVGLIVSGITIECGDKKIHKDPIPLRNVTPMSEEEYGME